ncbi:putative actin-crosslinking [Helianthus annuus]|nr:putative actin-crosslinking [Helianthus annuus]
MDVLRNDMIIRIKNNQGRYLVAQQDEESVSKSRDGSTKNAQWTVEMYDEESLYLKSCYGKYLTASNQPSIPGLIARNLRVTQTQPAKRNTSHRWLPVSQPDPREPHSVWLKTPHSSYLRSHYGPPPLGNLITHDPIWKDTPNPRNKKILWHIEIVDSPSNTLKNSISIMSKMLSSLRSFVSEKQKDKMKNNGMKVEKEKVRASKYVSSHKFNCKTF